MAKTSSPVMRLRADSKNRGGDAARFIRQILEGKRIKYILSFESAFQLFQTYVKIDPQLWKINVRSGEPIWCQAVRNAAKCTKTHKNPAIQSGTLCAIKGGGFCLPGKCPDGYAIDKPEIPIAGLEPPRVKPKPKKAKKRRVDDDDLPVEVPSWRGIADALVCAILGQPPRIIYRIQRALNNFYD